MIKISNNKIARADYALGFRAIYEESRLAGAGIIMRPQIGKGSLKALCKSFEDKLDTLIYKVVEKASSELDECVHLSVRQVSEYFAGKRAHKPCIRFDIIDSSVTWEIPSAIFGAVSTSNIILHLQEDINNCKADINEKLRELSSQFLESLGLAFYRDVSECVRIGCVGRELIISISLVTDATSNRAYAALGNRYARVKSAVNNASGFVNDFKSVSSDALLAFKSSMEHAICALASQWIVKMANSVYDRYMGADSVDENVASMITDMTNWRGHVNIFNADEVVKNMVIEKINKAQDTTHSSLGTHDLLSSLYCKVALIINDDIEMARKVFDALPTPPAYKVSAGVSASSFGATGTGAEIVPGYIVAALEAQKGAEEAIGEVGVTAPEEPEEALSREQIMLNELAKTHDWLSGVVVETVV